MIFLGPAFQHEAVLHVADHYSKNVPKSTGTDRAADVEIFLRFAVRLIWYYEVFALPNLETFPLLPLRGCLPVVQDPYLVYTCSFTCSFTFRIVPLLAIAIRIDGVCLFPSHARRLEIPKLS